MPVSAAAFELEGATVALRSVPVLRGVDFRLDSGEFVTLLGENGAGKTTLLRALLRLVPLTAGALRVFGEPAARFRSWERIAYVPQRPTAATGVPATVEEVVASGRVARVRPFSRAGGRDRERTAHALDLVDLAACGSRPVAELSVGQQQRVLIARALARDADVLVLDEPVSAVDVEQQEAFALTLARLKQSGRSILVAVHALGAMHDLVTRAVILHGGVVAYDGAPLAHHRHAGQVHHHPRSVAEESRL